MAEAIGKGSSGMGVADLFTKGYDQTEGAIVDYVAMKQKQKQREQDEKQFREKMAMEAAQFGVTSNQNQQQINQGNRAQNMKGIDFLAMQRQQAQQQSGPRSMGSFKADFYKSVVGG